MMFDIHVDIETMSALNLKHVGTPKYARHESTEVLCLAFSLDGGKTFGAWRQGDPEPSELLDAMMFAQNAPWAHNASFERNIWQEILHKRMGWPAVPEWNCSMVVAALLSLPLSLDKLGEFLELDVQKDKQGKALMMRMTKAENADKNTAAKMDRLVEYCIRDVATEVTALDKMLQCPTLPKMMAMEKDIQRVDRAINDRGVPIDVKLCEAIIDVLDVEKAKLNRRLYEATGGAVNTGQEVKKLTDWLAASGCMMPDLKADFVKSVLKRKNLSPEVRNVLELRQKTSQASTAKVFAMLNGVDDDGRARDTIQYYGASQTGRFAGRRFQPHNYPRLTTKDHILDWGIEAFMSRDTDMLDMLFGDCLTATKQMLRPIIRSESGMVVADYAQIELRVAAWLAGETRLLKIFNDAINAINDTARIMYGEGYSFRQRLIASIVLEWVNEGKDLSALEKLIAAAGIPDAKSETWAANESIQPIPAKHMAELKKLAAADAYIGMAGKIFGKSPSDITKDERFVGKVAMLGCQYQMGASRFQVTLENFGVKGTDAELQELAEKSVPAFRELHPNIKRLWKALDSGAIEAFETKARIKVGKLEFLRLPGTATLVMRLPSGRMLHYWYVEMEEGQYGMQLTHKTVRQGKIVRAGLYGGRWLENAAQAISRDLLCHAMVRMNDAGIPVFGHVHDEVLSEKTTPEEVTKYMTTDLPAWAKGLPVKVEAFACNRYTK